MQKHSKINRVSLMLTILFSLFLCNSGNKLHAQLSYKVLFIGNSYTSVNNLPQLIHDVALSAGDTLIFDSYTPGGYQLIDHSIDINCQNKIIAGGWDYVVIQGQSQEPVVASNQFNNGAAALYTLIRHYNPCAVIMPYMTWGRKNGDASLCPNFPLMCSYQSMDNELKLRYLNLASNLNGEVSPVSVVWKYLRQNYSIINLYQPDESHPSPEGSYAAACCFYASLFKKDPTFITLNSGLNANDATIIKNAAKTQVFDSLQVWNYKKLPVANIHFQIGPGINEVIFQAPNQGVIQSTLWDFGDGATSTTPYSTHSYSANGTYTVTLTTTNCDLLGLHIAFADTVIQFCSHTPTIYASHPWVCNVDTIWTQVADSYQWYLYGTVLPETNQYLTNFAQYNSMGFSVLSTLNGCAELSKTYTNSPQWSGFYFDALGDPCIGDTVALAVLHTNGFLSGLETILWYKNNLLLPSMINMDTLFISSSGKFECKVVNPNSNCPLDTTSYLIEYDCGQIVGIDKRHQNNFWTLFPNPASESVTIKFTDFSGKDQIQLYNAVGRLIKEMGVSEETILTISDLPKGLYFIRLKNNGRHSLKFFKE
ncbi:T9SS type A sorting domain-containing protein [Aurantibacillus circumpalustris]|uniref:T9SS type A sorting domain-containing protein n=1 Tax=Aurantibacillus circumpalustris TaxID=3036359 RepID=UPI00295B18FE|nr:T9SS type A sorting domain-containing protein [Aurantibacillus circumpalustris]